MVVQFHQTELHREGVLQCITDHDRFHFQSHLDQILQIQRKLKYTMENILFIILKLLNMLIPIFPMMRDLSAISR